jgi:hypothetical protein
MRDLILTLAPPATVFYFLVHQDQFKEIGLARGTGSITNHSLPDGFALLPLDPTAEFSVVLYCSPTNGNRTLKDRNQSGDDLNRGHDLVSVLRQ